MKRILISLASLVLILAAASPAMAQTNSPAEAAPSTNDPVRLDLASFQIIAQHNIFDPNRRARSNFTGPAPRPVQVDYFTFNGGGEVNHKRTAFFTGSSFRYSGRYSVNDTIGGYKIAEIDPGFDYVKLSASSNQFIKLEVMDQMRRSDSGPWSLVVNAPPEPDAKPVVAASDTPSNSPPASAGGGEDDIIKKLMLKREKENAK